MNPDEPLHFTVGDVFAEVVPCDETTDAKSVHLKRSACISPDTIKVACANALERSRLRFMGRGQGAELVVEGPNGLESLERQRAYAICPIGDEPKAIAALLSYIEAKHGAGKLWSHADAPVSLMVSYHDNAARGVMFGDQMHVVLVSYYFHQPDPR